MSSSTQLSQIAAAHAAPITLPTLCAQRRGQAGEEQGGKGAGNQQTVFGERVFSMTQE